TPRQRFRFLELMQILQNVAAQKHRCLALRVTFLDSKRALLRQLVKTGVETLARLGHEGPTELFERKFNVSAFTDSLLQTRNFLVGTVVACLRRQCDRHWVKQICSGPGGVLTRSALSLLPGRNEQRTGRECDHRNCS